MIKAIDPWHIIHMDVFEQKTLFPMAITRSVEPFDDPAFIYELKFDGVRCIAYLDSAGTELRNRHNGSLTPRFPEMLDVHKAAKAKCILDGELFVMKGGKPSFGAIQPRLPLRRRIDEAARRSPASYVAFDILYYEDRLVTELPLLERKALLSSVVQDTNRITVSRFISEHGIAMFEATKAEGLEGVVAKKADSLYYPGRNTTQWAKIKNLYDDDFVVCGYRKMSDGLNSLIVGKYQDSGLIYKGHVTLGVNGEAFRRIRELPHLETPPLKVPSGGSCATWVKPELVCAVQYLEITSNGNMRQAVLKGIREDMVPLDCTDK